MIFPRLVFDTSLLCFVFSVSFDIYNFYVVRQPTGYINKTGFFSFFFFSVPTIDIFFGNLLFYFWGEGREKYILLKHRHCIIVIV